LNDECICTGYAVKKRVHSWVFAARLQKAVLRCHLMPFKEVLEFLESKNLVHLAPSVAKLKIQNQKALLEVDAATLTQHDWNPIDISLLLRATGTESPVDTTPMIPTPRRWSTLSLMMLRWLGTNSMLSPSSPMT